MKLSDIASPFGTLQPCVDLRFHNAGVPADAHGTIAPSALWADKGARRFVA